MKFGSYYKQFCITARLALHRFLTDRNKRHESRVFIELYDKTNTRCSFQDILNGIPITAFILSTINSHH